MRQFRRILKSLCESTTNEVFATLRKEGFNLSFKGIRRYAFRPGANACSPLIVCHADTVANGGNGPHPYSYNNGTVNCIALDDRLGIACMIHGIRTKSFMSDCAMLVCDEEEIGNSSAAIFTEDIQPNWMVELDRRGTDAVCYDYETPILCSMLESVGFEIGMGSFSDICYLDGLEVCGFNIGIGYHNEHSPRCHAKLSDTMSQIAKLAEFHNRFWDIRLPHDPYTVYDKYDYAGTRSDDPCWKDFIDVDDNGIPADSIDYLDRDSRWA